MHAGRLACGDADRQLELAVGLEGRGEVRCPLVQRGLIALVLVLAMGVWFSASAVGPALASQWHLSAGAAAWLTTPVQAGFVAATAPSPWTAPPSATPQRSQPHTPRDRR